MTRRKKLYIGIPPNYTFSVMSPKLQKFKGEISDLQFHLKPQITPFPIEPRG